MSNWAKNIIEKNVTESSAKTIRQAVSVAVDAAASVADIEFDTDPVIETALSRGLTEDTEPDVIAETAWQALVDAVLTGQTAQDGDPSGLDALGNVVGFGSAVSFPAINDDDIPVLRQAIVCDIEHREYGTIAEAQSLLNGDPASIFGVAEIDLSHTTIARKI